MLLIGDGLFFGGLILFFGGSALWPGASLAYWTALMVPGMAGVLVLIELGRRVARRLRPERIGPFGRWLLEAELGQHWLRPSVLRRALHLVR
jgi:membrane protein implicated in regulation of membrane protease activity